MHSIYFHVSHSLASVGLTQVLGKNVGTSYIESQWDLTHFTVQSEMPCVCGFLHNKRAVVGELMHVCVCVGFPKKANALYTCQYMPTPI